VQAIGRGAEEAAILNGSKRFELSPSGASGTPSHYKVWASAHECKHFRAVLYDGTTLNHLRPKHVIFIGSDLRKSAQFFCEVGAKCHRRTVKGISPLAVLTYLLMVERNGS
jgi:hypothetical protein